MNIAIITNFKDACCKEDFILSQSFAEDGHKVDLLTFPMRSESIDFYDVLILKNAWDLNEKTYKNYFMQEANFFSEVAKKGALIINTLDGKLNFNKNGKKILVDLYKKGYNVVPTIDNMNDINLLPHIDEYIKKPIIGYDGFDMHIIKFDEIKTINLNNEILQPKLKFKSEVQMYFVNDEFQYALEYTPSKWPNYPRPKEITPTNEQINQAIDFIRINDLSCSFGRIDFLRLSEEKLVMLEMGDANPNMSLPLLSKSTLHKFLNNFKNAVYDFVGKKQIMPKY